MKKKNLRLFKLNKIGIIIYARMSSKRLPGKVLKKIYNNQSTSEIIINKLRKIGLKSRVIIATSNSKKDIKIIKFCKKKKVKYFLGSQNNVLNRTIGCIKKFNLNYIVRICADRPFYDAHLMSKMVNLMLKEKFDIVTNACPRTYPKGLTCEVANTKIFDHIDKNKIQKNDKEHIFNYFYRVKNCKIYNFKSKFNGKFLKKNFCIDTNQDFVNIKKIFLSFSKKEKKNYYRLII